MYIIYKVILEQILTILLAIALLYIREHIYGATYSKAPILGGLE